ncbi:MAG: hypothetical protein L6R41_003613 [Letrouitia leprolyta]|nr:MAG: hypothetical protein L6R41_003613 [Letrouitia leprolyta]
MYQLPAKREIERLRLRVKELEEQLHTIQTSNATNPITLPTPSLSSGTSMTTEQLDPLGDHGGSRATWQGIYMSTAQSQETQYYGPSSSFYFIGRMSSFLSKALQQPDARYQIQPNSASRSFASPTIPTRGVLEDNASAAEAMTGTQEEYFLNLFWQSYHYILQIIDETEFREHYKSLWTAGAPRKPSALVDIVLALCMQYGVAFTPRSGAANQLQADVDGSDATIAGRWLYRRSQTLLSSELESPSLMTLQCQILAVYYLCNASFQNMAHVALAIAVRTAQTLGLHLEPSSEGMPRKERELRKRLWWTLYVVESKTCMKLGRPWSAQIAQVTCSLPADDHELALESGSNFASLGANVTWLTYNLQNIKLILADRAIYISFYDKCDELLASNDSDGTTFHTESRYLDHCAHFLLSKMECLQAWLQDVPEALKTQRKGSGEPFTTDRSPLEIELFAPLWLQRQRLLLELLYHNLSMNLYRPFISFSTTRTMSPQNAEGCAMSCVNHAIAITNIMHQVLQESDILHGWHEAFQWQWNATLSMIGYILAYPLTPSSSSTRQAIDKAIEVFETFGRNFAMAASAANVTRDLAAKADSLTNRFESDLTSPTLTSPKQAMALQPAENLEFNVDEPSAMFQDSLAGSVDMAFTIDSFNNFEPMLTGSVDMSTMWNFAQN